MPHLRDIEPEGIWLGHTYPFALAKGIVCMATVTFERRVGVVRFVRFASPALSMLGYCSDVNFAAAVRAACASNVDG